MLGVRIAVVAAGLLLAGWTALSAVRTVILPRSVPSLLDRLVMQPLLATMRAVARLRGSFAWRDRVMAMYGPLSMVALVVTWLVLVLVGFMAVFWGVEQQGWADAFHESGSSLLTLGFASVDGTVLRALSFVEATLGFGLLALLITYLPTLYASFQRRERLVALLEVRAGTPASALVMLERTHRIEWLDRLGDLFSEWEGWFADVEESHTTFPVLSFLRSPQPDRHWVVAAGTVLDAAALTDSTLDLPAQPQARLAIRAGFVALRRIADFFDIAYDPEPRQGDPVSITRAEFDEACARLEEAGLPLRADRDRAWLDFAGWRVNYDAVLLALADLTMAPYAAWVSDRSTPSHRPVRVRRWGRRREGTPAGEPEETPRP
ncbi:MAG: hypothetical protein KQH83_06640 [Actinobacteria bacterium]|nr:hypothetical protein [Actinomycetota bacterium]